MIPNDSGVLHFCPKIGETEAKEVSNLDLKQRVGFTLDGAPGRKLRSALNWRPSHILGFSHHGILASSSNPLDPIECDVVVAVIELCGARAIMRRLTCAPSEVAASFQTGGDTDCLEGVASDLNLHARRLNGVEFPDALSGAHDAERCDSGISAQPLPQAGAQ
jgi:hypothetical protein